MKGVTAILICVTTPGSASLKANLRHLYMLTAWLMGGVGAVGWADRWRGSEHAYCSAACLAKIMFVFVPLYIVSSG
jgi:hypothetical protein